VPPHAGDAIDCYVVRWKDDDGFYWNKITTIDTEFVVSNLVPASNYELEVFAKNSAGNSSTAYTNLTTGKLCKLFAVDIFYYGTLRLQHNSSASHYIYTRCHQAFLINFLSPIFWSTLLSFFENRKVSRRTLYF